MEVRKMRDERKALAHLLARAEIDRENLLASVEANGRFDTAIEALAVFFSYVLAEYDDAGEAGPSEPSGFRVVSDPDEMLLLLLQQWEPSDGCTRH